MKHRILFLIMFLFGSLCANAQSSTLNPPPGPAPTGGNSREVEDSFNQMKSLEIPRVGDSANRALLIELTRNIYRKPTKEEMKLLAPAPDLLDKYALFLRQPDTGIIKLHADSSCAENTKVVPAKENCVPYSMPGAGTAYSFRVESHRIPRLADLILSKNVLKTYADMQQGIMVSLGDVPLEEVTLQTRGLKYLVDFEPPSDVESLSKFGTELNAGIKADGFVYGFGVYVKKQVTFALRSIAYKGKVMRSVKGINYNELDFDKRKDIIVAFRVIDQEAGGNITLLWKMLSQKDSPTWKQPKDNK